MQGLAAFVNLLILSVLADPSQNLLQNDQLEKGSNSPLLASVQEGSEDFHGRKPPLKTRDANAAVKN